jgi:hypothetical protein
LLKRTPPCCDKDSRFRRDLVVFLRLSSQVLRNSTHALQVNCILLSKGQYLAVGSCSFLPIFSTSLHPNSPITPKTRAATNHRELNSANCVFPYEFFFRFLRLNCGDVNRGHSLCEAERNNFCARRVARTGCSLCVYVRTISWSDHKKRLTSK